MLGFHFAGNYGYIDKKGYLRIPKDFEKESYLHLQPSRRINSEKLFFQKIIIFICIIFFR